MAVKYLDNLKSALVYFSRFCQKRYEISEYFVRVDIKIVFMRRVANKNKNELRWMEAIFLHRFIVDLFHSRGMHNWAPWKAFVMKIPILDLFVQNARLILQIEV